jgi:hypothetical protein
MRFRRQVVRPLVVDPCMGDATAVRLRDALGRQDWPATRSVLGRATHPDDRAFYLGVCASVPDVQEWIADYVITEPDSTLPLLVRGCHAVGWAWEARGQLDVEDTRPEQFAVFHERLRIADRCLNDVVIRDPDEVAAWAFLIRTARGLRLSIDDGRYRYEQAVRRHPTNLKAHYELMQTLCAKWGGSDDEMHRFARAAADRAPAGNLLPYLVAVAHLEMMVDLQGGDLAGYVVGHNVRAQLRNAAERSIWHREADLRPGWQEPGNAFAMAFGISGDQASAARAFDQVGDVVTAQPWAYLGGDAAKVFAAARQRATGTPARR